MSHFSNIKTKIRNVDSLKSALKDMEITWKSGPSPVRGYKGQSQTAEVVIEQENDYDIGFSWNGSEYELVADLQYWKQPLTVDGFLSRLTQGYAFHTIVNETEKQGFQISEQQKNEDGSIRLVVQRWN
ncbi:MAG: DUF1257 domain-containing protein [Limnothrix sp.]